MDFNELTKLAVKAALNAGKLIQSYRDREVEVLHKEGKDSLAAQVVTEVDHNAQDAILEVLLPTCLEFEIALLTEESEDDRSRFEKEYFWCIDPMDGTLPFTEGKAGYAVSIGLVSQYGEPLIGVVYDPVSEVLYQATKDQGAHRNGESWMTSPKFNVLTCTYDRSFQNHPKFQEVLQELDSYAQTRGLEGLAASQHAGAVLNTCYALEQAPGCYFKFPQKKKGGCSIWDYAATACLFKEAGAVVGDVYGDPLDLNRSDSTFMNHRGAIYATDVDLARKIQEIISG